MVLPVVSVIIPTYNRENFICKAIESVLNQTYTSFELIVVDDGSTDKTEKRVRKYKSLIKYVKKKHSGVSSARNLGISVGKGTYYAFLDSDDVWMEEKLTEQMSFILSGDDIKICQTNEKWIRKGKLLNQKNRHKKLSGWIFEQSLSLCLISPSSVVIHKNVFDKIGVFNENLPACEDYDLWLRIASFYPVFLLDKTLVIKHGGHNDQLSSSIYGLDRFRIVALENLLKSKNQPVEHIPLIKGVLKKKVKIYSEGCLKRGKVAEYNYYRKKYSKI